MKSLWSLKKAGYLLATALLASSIACGGGEADVECGDDELNIDGECVDANTVCGPNTVYENGECVIAEPVECGLNTQLDPNTNECVVTDTVCGGHTAYDSATDSCLPTSDICEDGTIFDEEAGLCYPSVQCQAGDVAVEGFCLSPAEALAANADVDAGGANSNPDEGGTPHGLTIGDIDEATVFTGTIIDPAEVKDGELAQHFDFYSFSAQEGDWFEISVQSLGLPSPHFEVWLSYDGERHWYRSASAYTGNNKARQIVVPRNAQVIVQVGPEPAFWGAPPIGGEGWDYVGTVTQIPTPSATPHNFPADGNLSGTLGRLDTNYFVVEGYAAGSFVNFTVDEGPQNANLYVQAWASATEFIGEFNSTFNVEVPDSGELFLLADWDLSIGHYGLDYEVSGREIINLGPGATYTQTVSAENLDVLEVRQDNDGGTTLQVSIAQDGGGTILEQQLTHMNATGTDSVARFIGVESGNYTVTITNAGETTVEDFQAFIRVITPTVVDDLDATYSGDAMDNTRGTQNYWVVELTEATDVELTLQRTSGTGSAKMFIYGANDELYFRHPNNSLTSPISTLFTFEANTPYIIRVGNDLTSTLNRDFSYDLTFHELVWYPGASVTVNDGDVIEMTQSGSSTLNIRLRDADGTVYADTLAASGSGSLRRYIAASAGTYTIYTTTDGASVTLDTLVPTEITDMSATITGSSHETLIFPQDFYLVQLPTTETYDVQITHTGGSGWARAYIYALGNNELASHTANATSSNSVQTFNFTFEANTIYVIRVGMNNTGTSAWPFDYMLDFID